MADHLGVVHSSQLIDEIAAATDIDKMRAGKSEKLKDEEIMSGISVRETLVLYRKGQTYSRDLLSFLRKEEKIASRLGYTLAENLATTIAAVGVANILYST